MQEFKNLLIIRTDRIGDVVLTTPAIQALRHAFPRARISILVSPSTRMLVEGNPDLDEVLVDDRKGEHKGLKGFLHLVNGVKAKRYDLAINFHTKKRTNILCYLAGIPCRLGYDNNKFSFLLTDRIKDIRHLGHQHEVGYCYDLVKGLGVRIAEDYPLYVPIHPEAELWAEKFFNDNRLDRAQFIFAIHPGASCPTKKWPLKYFADIIHQLGDKYSCDMILMGGKEGFSDSKSLAEMVDTPVIDVTGETNVAQLTSLLKRCHLLISNDSGPVHIAAALDIPVISIFTRNQAGINPERWKPLGKNSRYVAPPVNNDISFAKGIVYDPKYLEIIKVEDILEAVDGLFKVC